MDATQIVQISCMAFVFENPSAQKLYFAFMGQRKLWNKEEDNLLTKIMEKQGSDPSVRKLKWNEIANLINELSGKSTRKGKQCRERWFNQLHPNINKEQVWLPEEQQRLFELQGQYGNHWSKIAKGLPGRSDNNIKNYFYSCLRKALRKVNSYLYNNKRVPQYKNIKPFQKNTLSKILTVAEKNAESKLLIAKEEAPLLAKHIKNLLIKAQVKNSQLEEEHSDQTMPEIISSIQQFNRICKRKKKKRSFSEKREQELISEESDEEEMLSERVEEDCYHSERIQCIEPANLASEIEKQFPLMIKQQGNEGSQTIKCQELKLSPIYSGSSSLAKSMQVKKGVIIPLVRSNSMGHSQGQINEAQKIIGTTIPTASDVENLQQSQQFRQRSFVPCTPLVPFSYYQQPSLVENGFTKDQSYSPDQKARLSRSPHGAPFFARSLEMFSLASLATIFGKTQNPKGQQKR